MASFTQKEGTMITKFHIAPTIAHACAQALRENPRLLRFEKIGDVRPESILAVASLLEDFSTLAGQAGYLTVTYEAEELFWGEPEKAATIV